MAFSTSYTNFHFNIDNIDSKNLFVDANEELISPVSPASPGVDKRIQLLTPTSLVRTSGSMKGEPIYLLCNLSQLKPEDLQKKVDDLSKLSE